MSTNFNIETRSENVGNGRILSIEGCILDIVDQDLNVYMEFQSHFLNNN